ncbi:MAG: glycine cleavage system protein H [Candidatus Lernaella stagnicola]|nr:glycine cleavage system protein H [Candidatus Lernaella stagnicola]
MVFALIFATFLVAIAVDALVIKRLAERKAKELAKNEAIDQYLAPKVEEQQNLLFHQGHTWVRVLRAVVEVGLDDFTNRFVGAITKIDVPEVGAKVEKGQRAWTIHFGERSLTQMAPISGRVIEVNHELLENPGMLADAPYQGWVVKILPEALASEVPDLYTPSRFLKWIDMQKARLVQESFPELGMAYGDGAQMINGAASQLDDDKWEAIAKKLFGSK